MKTVLRSIAAVVVGFGTTFALVIAVEAFSAVVHPFPEGLEPTMEEMCRHVERYPQWILAAVVPMWAFAAFAGTWTARRIGNFTSSAIVGLLVVATLACNVSMLPYPLWFKIACLLAVPAAAFAGSRRRAGQMDPLN